jgi:hypothetical protein
MAEKLAALRWVAVLVARGAPPKDSAADYRAAAYRTL